MSAGELQSPGVLEIVPAPAKMCLGWHNITYLLESSKIWNEAQQTKAKYNCRVWAFTLWMPGIEKLKKTTKQAPKIPNQQQQNPRTCRVYLHVIAKRCMNPGVLQTLCSNDVAMTLEEMLSIQAKTTRYRITCRIQHSKDSTCFTYCQLILYDCLGAAFFLNIMTQTFWKHQHPHKQGLQSCFFHFFHSFFQTENFNCHLNQCNNQCNMEGLGPSSSKHLNTC